MKKIKTVLILSLLLLLLVSCGNSNSHKIKLGTQTWAAKNLSVTVFRNGDAIDEARTNEEWLKAGCEGKAAWCYYGNNRGNEKKYGRLYNWFAVMDPRGLAPLGWHIPSDREWDQLITFLGGDSSASIKMKSKRGWEDIGNGINSSGFSALPGGWRSNTGEFKGAGGNGSWWSSTEYSAGYVWYFSLEYFTSVATRDNNSDKKNGISVRCLMD
jgi:uncharacterized protein (TIGR02145 family)